MTVVGADPSQRPEEGTELFHDSADEVHHSVRLDGSAYGMNGALVAQWRSSASRLDHLNVTYVREGNQINKPKWLPGLGIIDFTPAAVGGRIREGIGQFWEGDDSNPGATVIKSVEIRRVQDDSYTKVMTEGSCACSYRPGPRRVTWLRFVRSGPETNQLLTGHPEWCGASGFPKLR